MTTPTLMERRDDIQKNMHRYQQELDLRPELNENNTYLDEYGIRQAKDSYYFPENKLHNARLNLRTIIKSQYPNNRPPKKTASEDSIILKGGKSRKNKKNKKKRKSIKKKKSRRR